MAANYLHGAETITILVGARPVKVIKTAVIGLIGFAPAGPVNEPTLVLGPADAAQFGEPVPGHTIPQALDMIFKQGSATVIVVNVFDDTANAAAAALVTADSEPHTIAAAATQLNFKPSSTTITLKNSAGTVTYTPTTQYTVAASGAITIVDTVTIPNGTVVKATYTHLEDHTVTNMKFQLVNAPIGVITVKNALQTTTYVLDTDYTVDEYGVVSVIPGGAISEGGIVVVSYNYFDQSSITNDQIIGEIDGTTNERSGTFCFDLCFSLFGYNPKIFICPGFETVVPVFQALQGLADLYRGYAITDGEEGWLPADAISARGPLTSNTFNTSHKRTLCCYPRIKKWDKATQADVVYPMSVVLAGMIAANDSERGYWFSTSNLEMKGTTGVEYPVTWAINRADTEANALNEVGIITVAAGFGTGRRVWGNRAANFPAAQTADTFYTVLRTADVVDESLELASLEFIDKPITNAVIDSIVETANAFINTLISRGALVDGSYCFFDPADNPPTEIAAGHLTFTKVLMGPPPLERLTYKTLIDITLLENLTGGN